MNSYLFLDSKNISYGDVSKGNYKLNLDLQYVNSVGLSSYDLTYNVKNINSVNKDKVYFDDGIQSYPVELEEGWHNYLELATVIQEALNNAVLVGTPFVVSYDSNTHSYTITNTTFDFTLRKLTSDRTWLEMIDITPDTPLASSQVGGPNVNLNYTNKIYVVSDKLHQYKQVGDYGAGRVNNVLGVIYIIENEPQQLNKADDNAPQSIYPKIISKRIENIKYIQQNTSRVLSDIDIQLLDDFGFPMPTGDLDYTLELLTQ